MVSLKAGWVKKQTGPQQVLPTSSLPLSLGREKIIKWVVKISTNTIPQKYFQKTVFCSMEFGKSVAFKQGIRIRGHGREKEKGKAERDLELHPSPQKKERRERGKR